MTEEKTDPSVDRDDSFYKGDGNEDIDPLDLDKIREKTFTSEFKELISRVTAHDDRVKDLSQANYDDLLLLFQSLFYRAAALDGLDEVHSAFNPFMISRDSPEADCTAHIRTALERMGYSGYAILSYQRSSRALFPSVSTINDIRTEDLIFNINEKTIQRVLSSKRGLLVDSAFIENNIFMKKRWSGAIRLKGVRYYIVAVQSLISDYFDSLASCVNIDRTGTTGILILRLPEGDIDRGKEALHRQIASRLAMHLLLYNHLAFRREILRCGDSLEDAYSLAEYFYSLHVEARGGNIVVIKPLAGSQMEIYYGFRYLYIRLARSVSLNARVLFLKRDAILVFADDAETGTVMNTVDDFNSYFDTAYTAEIIRSDKSFSLYRILEII